MGPQACEERTPAVPEKPGRFPRDLPSSPSSSAPVCAVHAPRPLLLETGDCERPEPDGGGPAFDSGLLSSRREPQFQSARLHSRNVVKTGLA